MSSARPILPVILSGGAGSRLWPLSRKAAAKQFLPLAGDRTMLQDTVARFSGERFAPPVFICNADHVETIKDQVAEIGAIIVEPVGRNTAPCAVVAAAHALAHHPGALVLLAPADHVIAQPDRFTEAVIQAAPVASQGRHVTFGMTPDHPATGFGYIQQGEPLEHGLHAIESFREKPDPETARDYVESGRYHWNGGIFLLDPETVQAEMRSFAPDTAGPAERAYDEAKNSGDVIALDPSHFADCRAEPIDIALMERTRVGAVLPCEIGWQDVGSFAAYRDLHADGAQPVLRGDALVHDAPRSLVDTDGPLVAVVGLEDVGVIVRDGRVLVLALDRSQDVKQIVTQLKDQGREDML